MIRQTGIVELDDVLSRLARAADRDTRDDVMIELAKIAPRHIDALAALCEQESHLKMSIIWSLIGRTGPDAFTLFETAIRDRDQYTRWAAAKALARFRTRAASALLVDALKDRSHLVKATAVRAMMTFRDPRAVSQLEKTVASEYLKKHAPGLVDDAQSALRRCKAAEQAASA